MNRSDGLALATLTTVEAAEAWAQVNGGIVAIGSLEQHGPNLGMSVDTAIADALARELAKHFSPRLVLLPAVPYGVSYHHMAFTGSLTIRAETLDAVVTDLATSLAHHGVRTLIVVNGHGGNTAPLATTFSRLRAEGFRVAALSWFGLAGDIAAQVARSPLYGHACEVETSVALALVPQLVRRESLTPGRVKAVPFRFGDIRERRVWRPRTGSKNSRTTERSEMHGWRRRRMVSASSRPHSNGRLRSSRIFWQQHSKRGHRHGGSSAVRPATMGTRPAGLTGRRQQQR
jgi:creatinine amidohydrolase